MKIKLTIFAITLFFLQNIFSQQLNVNEESKPHVNQAGEPFVRGPLTPNVGKIDTSPSSTGFQGQRTEEPLTPDEMINMQNQQLDPNEIRPGKTYLHDVQEDLTGAHETVVYGGNNENSNSNQAIIPLIIVITIIVLFVLIIIKSKSNTGTDQIEKEATIVFEPSKILTELEKLQSLRQTGVITEEEFNKLKKKILNNS